MPERDQLAELLADAYADVCGEVLSLPSVQIEYEEAEGGVFKRLDSSRARQKGALAEARSLRATAQLARREKRRGRTRTA